MYGKNSCFQHFLTYLVTDIYIYICIYIYTYIYLIIMHLFFFKKRRTESENMHFLRTIVREWGHEVVQLVEELRHKPEGRGFDSRWGRLSL